jgi:hypothetical protein
MRPLALLNWLMGNARARRLGKYAGIAALAVVGFEVVYLLIANILLSTSLIRSGVGSAGGVRLRYAEAHTFWPGTVHVRDLALRVEDYNVQFELDIERARFNVSFHDLVAKRFHATQLRAQGVSFRMRHKVHAVGSDAARLAAYPPIEGFADPPLYRGPPPPPTSNPEALWSVQIEDVVASVKQLWVLEYRFRGDAEVRGSFLLRPALKIRVQPSELAFQAGSLQAGEHVVSHRVHGKLSFDMPELDVRSTEGKAVFGEMSARALLELDGVELDFLNLYLPHVEPFRAGGGAKLRLGAALKRGTLIAADSTLEAPNLTLQTKGGEFVGKAAINAVQRDAREPLRVSARIEQATFSGHCEKSATVKALDASLDLTRVDLTKAVESGAMSAAGSLQAPDIACFDALVSEQGAVRHLGGSANASFQIARDASAQGIGRAELDVQNGSYRAGDTHFQGDLHSVTRFRFDKGESGTAYAQGAVSLRLGAADSLLSLAVAPLFQKLIKGTLALDELSANIAFHAERDALQLALTSATSGLVDAKGHLHVPFSGADSAKGAVLFSSGPIHVGVELNGSSTSVRPLVSEDWLEPTAS